MSDFFTNFWNLICTFYLKIGPWPADRHFLNPWCKLKSGCSFWNTSWKLIIPKVEGWIEEPRKIFQIKNSAGKRLTGKKKYTFRHVRKAQISHRIGCADVQTVKTIWVIPLIAFFLVYVLHVNINVLSAQPYNKQFKCLQLPEGSSDCLWLLCYHCRSRSGHSYALADLDLFWGWLP